MLVNNIHPFQCIDIPRIHHPHIKHLVQDREVLVRYTYAQCIVQLADTAVQYLEMGQPLKAHGVFKLSAEAHEHEYENAVLLYLPPFVVQLLIKNYLDIL